MTLLVLNRRGIVDLIPGLGDLTEDLVLVTARSALRGSAGLSADAPAGYRQVIVVHDYDAPEMDDLIVDVARRHNVPGNRRKREREFAVAAARSARPRKAATT